jgi:hypothetical protein
VEYDCADASSIAYVPCSATERLRAPADFVTAGMDIHKTCFELGCEDDDSDDSNVVGNAKRWLCAPQSAASLLTKSWRGGAGVVWCAGAGGKRT